MPLLKVFEIIENLFGFVDDEQEYQYRSNHSKRKISETTDIYINCVNTHSTVQLLDSSSVSLLFVFLFFIFIHNRKQNNELISIYQCRI
jgi:hypothetical protein